MILEPLFNEIPLGVECAWPFRIEAPRPRACTKRRRRLTEAWRRILAVFRSPRRRGWTG